jgi:protein-L-isoaspartate(D-aspartate) O-methyltransferase
VSGWQVPFPSAVKTDAELRRERRDKVAELERRGLLRSERLRAAMLTVPREDFAPPAWRDHAYAEVPLPLPGRSATISCPHSYPLFYEALDLLEGHRFLEVGTGSGYGAALARQVVGPAGRVVSVEIDPASFAFASANLERTGHHDVVRVLGDGALGYPHLAPYDRICVTAACDEVPSPLLEQLGVGGRLIAPLRRDRRQVLTLIEKQAEGLRLTEECDVLYVDLQGQFGATHIEGRLPALVVTCHDLGDGWRARRAIRHVLPQTWVTHSPFRGVLLVDSDGDPVQLAARLAGSRDRAIARVAAVLAGVPSARQQMLEAATEVGTRQITPGQTFAVRIHKRGAHGYLDPTPTLERDTGAAIRQALWDRDGTPPRVDLARPDLTIDVEVLGPRTLVCAIHKAWA